MADPLALREVLRNLLTNIRHAGRRQGGRQQPTVEVDPFQSVIDEERVDCWAIRVRNARVKDYRAPGPDSTFMKQAAEIKQYGGTLGMSDGDGFVTATLVLIARDEMHENKK